MLCSDKFYISTILKPIFSFLSVFSFLVKRAFVLIDFKVLVNNLRGYATFKIVVVKTLERYSNYSLD